MRPLERLTHRVTFRGGIIVFGAMCLAPSSTPAAAENNDTAIRPFRVNVPDADLADLKRRLTTIDGVDIQFIHVRSRHPNAMPLIITHGWPGSVFEQIKLIGPLSDPTRYGGRAEDALRRRDPVPAGFGFSARPTEAGWGLERIGRAWDVLMKRLGYTRYVAQGGDWGAGVVQAMGRQAPSGLVGIHTNLPAAVTNDVGAALGGGPAPAGFSAQERAAVDDLRTYLHNGGLTCLVMMGARPQAVGYGLTDSPAGLAGWMLVHGGFDKWSYGKDPAQSRRETMCWTISRCTG